MHSPTRSCALAELCYVGKVVADEEGSAGGRDIC